MSGSSAGGRPQRSRSIRSRADLPQLRIDVAAFPDPPSTLDECVHAVTMQPEQRRGELSQIVSSGAGRQPPRSPKRIGGLLLQRRKPVLDFDRAGHAHRTNPQLIVCLQHGQLAEVHSSTRGLAPNSPVRRIDQDGLVRPNVEPDVGPAPTWKTPRRNADLAPLAKLQIAIFRCELDWQPLVRNGKLPHISGVLSQKTWDDYAARATNVAKRRSKLPI
jgi:hypothetical protein